MTPTKILTFQKNIRETHVLPNLNPYHLGGGNYIFGKPRLPDPQILVLAKACVTSLTYMYIKTLYVKI